MWRVLRLARSTAAMLLVGASVRPLHEKAPKQNTSKPGVSKGVLGLEETDAYNVISSWVEHDIFTCNDPEVPKLCEARRQAMSNHDQSSLVFLNYVLYRKLLGSRRFLWSELPANTRWYKAELTWEELENKTTVQPGWPKELRAQAPEEQKKFKHGELVLFGASTDNLMLLEGNTRFQQWVANGRPPTGKQTVYVGLSADKFYWAMNNHDKSQLSSLYNWSLGSRKWS